MNRIDIMYENIDKFGNKSKSNKLFESRFSKIIIPPFYTEKESFILRGLFIFFTVGFYLNWFPPSIIYFLFFIIPMYISYCIGAHVVYRPNEQVSATPNAETLFNK